MVKTKTKLFALTYHQRKGNWTYSVIKKRPKKVGINTSIVRETTPTSALRKLSMQSYRAETGRRR